MIAPPIPTNEKERLVELYKYELLDTDYEDDFNDIVGLASRICQVPISLITLVDLNRQWFKARIGLEPAETARDISFCGHAIQDVTLFEVPDALLDERFFDNPLVLEDPNIRYYAGMPLVTAAGYKIGTLCVIDRVPRELDDEQSLALQVLSRQVIKLFELRIKNKELKKILAVQQNVTAILAHDIRNPLAGISATIDLKKNGDLDAADIVEFDSLIEIQLKGTLDLLDNIVDWGQLQLFGPASQAALFSLHDLCEDCFSQIVLSAMAKRNILVNDISTGLALSAHRQGISFMLRNLLGNANKFTADGTITVSARLTDGVLLLTVKDTGVGMSDKARKSLLDRTWSATERGTNQEKGSGVGLKLIFEYLQDVKGSIDITSLPGMGTVVLISLPFIGSTP